MFRETPFSLVANEMSERIKTSRLPSGLLLEPARSRGDNPDWNRPSRPQLVFIRYQTEKFINLPDNRPDPTAASALSLVAVFFTLSSCRPAQP